MESHASIRFLFFSSVIGVLVLSSNIGAAPTPKTDLYVLDDDDKPVKIDLDAPDTEANLKVKDLPNRVLFYLYTRNTQNNPKRLIVGDSKSLTNSQFNPRKPTKIITHGWTNSKRSKACTKVRDAFLSNGDYNVIVVDWSSISRRPYVWTSNQVPKIAQFIGTMIDYLQTQGMNPSQLTIVGHSLGGHIAGLSSYYAKNKAQYVVALDPAGPNFHLNGRGSRVSKGDATYVQIIHTSNLLGLTMNLGDSDFYPNGGSAQNSCKMDVGGSCSHSRSYEYFAESINNNGFLARRCGSYKDFGNGRCNSNPIGYMGGLLPNFNVEGSYYLNTNSRSPYAKHSVL
ncbi:phospholipase A1-like [Osmia bicornis bicornis]|uniref:phospholipase A1-like n=1 Tax=Osmia bicornis bicornis TaxID=1437191 RepID=UPI001EAEAF3A|nr:phospholipase A1-like [Osmia bicornis bicornis]